MISPRRVFWFSASLIVFALRLGAGTGLVEQWDVFELELRGPAEGNPFTEVEVSARFTDGTRSVEAEGFYDGEGVYRVRFMPEAAGKWSYRTASNRAELAGREGEFFVTPPSPGNHGPVRVAREHHFAYADGTPFRPVGTTIYGWMHRSEELREQTLRTLAASPFNKARMLLLPQDFPADQAPPPVFAFEGRPPADWNLARFNPAFFRHVEACIRRLRELGVECDLILFHPYGKMWGMDHMDAAGDDRYVRQVVARFAAFRNIWWSLANEYDFLRWKRTEDWDRMLRLVQRADPSAHLRSIHNGTNIYNHTQPWVTHASIQCGAAVEEAGRAELFRSAFRKPVVYDEVKYEGNVEMRWGRLDGREMTHRFWTGTVAGAYVGHGECLRAGGDREATWISRGGELRGESPARIAFLRRILEEGPTEGIDPIDKWQPPSGMGGRPGSYYLLYFGREAPTEWAFELYKNGLREGMRFQVEVIDTWEMSVSPVEGVFVTKKKDSYTYVDAERRVVALLGKPGIALRIRRVDGDADGSALESSDE